MRWAIFAIFATVLMLGTAFSGIGLARQKGQTGTEGIFEKPWWSKFTWSGKKQIACATVHQPVRIHAATRTGVVRTTIETEAIACGGASVLTQGGFWTAHFTPTVTGYYNLTVQWSASFSVMMLTAIGVLGTSHAEGSAIFYMNVYDTTDAEWVFGNYLANTVYNPGLIDDGIDYWDMEDGVAVNITGNGYLTAGHAYQFSTYFENYCESVAVGLVSASCEGNWGSGPNSANLSYAYWALV